MNASRDATPAIQLLRPKEAAAVLAVSDRTLWSMTASGELPHLRIRRCVRYRLSDLHAWVAERLEGGDQ